MNIKQHKFVTEYLRFSDKIIAYHNAYPNPNRKDRATESAANRLMQHPEVSKAISDAQETCMSRAMEDLKDKMKEELLTVYQKRLLCKHVVLGEVREEVVFKGKGCAHCSYFREIPYSVKLRYSKEDSLLAGHYPDKRANKHNKTQQNTACPPLAGVARYEPGVGTRDVHSYSTITNQETRNKLQQPNEINTRSHNTSPLQGDRGTTHDVHSHKTNEPPKTRNKLQQKQPISHAGLRKLFNKQRSKHIQNKALSSI